MHLVMNVVCKNFPVPDFYIIVFIIYFYILVTESRDSPMIKMYLIRMKYASEILVN